MRISERIVESAAGARDRAAAYALKALDAARNGAGSAADRFEAADKPIGALAEAARQLNTLSHRYVARMVDQGATAVNGMLADGAKRLRLAADAVDVKSAYREQLDRVPASRARLIKDARATWTIMAEAGRELQSLALETYAHLVRPEKTQTTKTTQTTQTTQTTKTAKKKRARRKG